MDSIDPDPLNDPDPDPDDEAVGPDDDEPTDEPTCGPDDVGPDAEPDDDGAAAGASRSRRALRVLLFVAAAVIAGRVALSSPPSGTGDTATSDQATDAGAPAEGGGGDQVTTTVVDDPDAPTRPERPAIDLAAVPQPGAPPAEVARWWAATYAAWVGAESGEDLADRLAAGSTAALADRLRAAPPPASYGEPDEVVGAAAGPALPRDSGVQVLVTVETAVGVAAYQLDLVDLGADGWRVDAVAVL